MKAKRILSMLLAGLMVAGMSVSAFANETGTKTDNSTPPAQETPNEAPEGDYSVMPLGTPDETAPTLISVSMDKSKVAPGGTIDVTLEVSDDVSGVAWLYVKFVNQENGRSIKESYYVDEPIKDGIISFDIEINEFEPSGVFELDHVEICDTSGNGIIYGWEDADLPNEVSFTIMNENIEDEKAPILHEVSVNKKEVHALGLITVNLTVSDDVSGVDWLYVKFVNQENGRSIKESYYVDEPIKDGIISFDIEINEFEPSGVFELDHVEIRDTSGNGIIYGWEDADLPNEVSFTIMNENIEDEKAPILHEVSVNKKEVHALGLITVNLTVSDDVSGVDWLYVKFVNQENGRSIKEPYYVDVPIKDGIISFDIEINEFEPSGVFELDHVEIRDTSGNGIIYGWEDADLPNEVSFAVVNTVDTENGDIVTSTNNSELAEDVDQMEDGNTAYIYYGNDATLDEEVFDAVAGTDKKLVLSSDGIQWEFDGKTVDADKAKDLELDVDIERDRRSDSENADEIEEALGTKNSIIVSFPENGELPGPAKIRIKMDHVFRDYIDYKDGEATVYVYYYDNSTGEFVEVASNLAVGTDEYLEFTITHNSDFVIMNGAYVKPEDKPEDDTNDKPTWTPSYDDDEDEDGVVLEDDKEKITVEEFANGTVKANRKSASKGQKVTFPLPQTMVMF